MGRSLRSFSWPKKHSHSVKRHEHSRPTILARSTGVLAFELCTGQTLFAQDIADDNIKDDADLQRLCLWLSPTEIELASVFKDASVDGVPQEMCERARHFIRWCLQARFSALRSSLPRLTSRRHSPAARCHMGLLSECRCHRSLLTQRPSLRARPRSDPVLPSCLPIRSCNPVLRCRCGRSG